MGNYRDSGFGFGPLTWFIGGIVLLALVIFIIGGLKSINHTKPGEVAVIYNGGPLDAQDIREVRPPSSPWKVSGLFSSVRKYYSSDTQRYYTVSTDPARADDPGATNITVPTKDGVHIAIEGTAFFNTGFTGLNDDPLLKQFDTEYGNREFRGHDGEAYKVYEGNEGWNAFLDTIFRPVLENTIREEVGARDCSDFVSSCVLVDAGASQAGSQQIRELAREAQDGATDSFDQVQIAIQEKLEERVEQTLGGAYLQNFQFKLVKVELPESLQTRITETQGAFAEIATAQAEAAKAKFEAEKDRLLSKQYQDSPELAQIRIAESLPSDANVFFGVDPGGIVVPSGK